jgi:hypothetical protein
MKIFLYNIYKLVIKIKKQEKPRTFIVTIFHLVFIFASRLI